MERHIVRRKMSNKVIMLDYDGTIALTNIGLELQRRFAIDPARFEYLLRQFELGIMDTVDVVRAGWANVKPDLKALLRATDEITYLRRGFFPFLKRCQGEGYSPIIVSGGMSFYIERWIREVPIIAGTFVILDDRVIAIMPCDIKLEVARYLRPDIYIGNGSTDVLPSSYAEKVYGVRYGKLAKVDGVIPFETFDEIMI